MNNKLSLLTLLSLPFFMQSSNEFFDGVHEVPSNFGRTFVVEHNTQMGQMMDSMDEAEFNCQLRSAQQKVLETSAQQVVDEYDQAIQNIERAMIENPSMAGWLANQKNNAVRIRATIAATLPSSAFAASASAASVPVAQAAAAVVVSAASASLASASAVVLATSASEESTAFAGFDRNRMRNAFGRKNSKNSKNGKN